MNDRHLMCILGQSNPQYAKNELSCLILRKNMKYGPIPRGYTQVLSKMRFFLIKAMELEKFVFRRKDLTLIYICDIIFFKKIYIKSYIKITKVFHFRSFNIKLREICVVMENLKTASY